MDLIKVRLLAALNIKTNREIKNNVEGAGAA